MTYILHITLTTGHTRRSPAAEVTAETRQMLAPVLRAALQSRSTIPYVGDYQLTGTAEGRSASVWTIWSGDVPIITVGVARTSRAGAPLWRRLHELHVADAGVPPVVTDPQRPPQAPWCAARLDAGIELHPDVSEWAGDLERCIAWTWLEDMT